MSRVGKKPISLPQGVEVKIADDIIAVKGPKGELKWALPRGINVSVNNGTLAVEISGDTKNLNALHGLTQSNIANMVKGVNEGYQKVLEITGVGYKAQVQGSKLMLTLGYSHPIEFMLPTGITAGVDAKQTQITLKGIDKHLIGQVAANIRSLRPPDIYKGKGIRYVGEVIKLKAGKAGKK